MKRSLVILCAASMSLSSLSFAQGRDHGSDHGPDHNDHRAEQRQYQSQTQKHDDHHRAHDDHRRHPPQSVVVVDQRGAGPQHNFRRGGRLPMEYRNHQYVVDNWRAQRLSAPPRGYHWVQTGSDYVLVAIASGIIAQILLSQ